VREAHPASAFFPSAAVNPSVSAEQAADVDAPTLTSCNSIAPSAPLSSTMTRHFISLSRPNVSRPVHTPLGSKWTAGGQSMPRREPTSVSQSGVITPGFWTVSWPTATYRKVTGGFRSKWGADLFASVRSVVGTAARRGIDAYQAIRAVLDGEFVVQPG
jgi:hypothetical protein